MKCLLYLPILLLCISLAQAQTTTPAPSTTANVSTTNATTKAPTTKATTTVPSTTSVPTTPAPSIPVPTEGSWNVTDGNTTCIKADLKIRFKITVGNDTVYILLPPDASKDGSTCNAINQTQTLVLSSGNFSLAFNFAKDSSTTFAQRIAMTVTLDKEQETFFTNNKLFSVTKGHSFMCKSTLSIPMDNATMEIMAIRLQAFGVEGANFGAAEICEQDDKVSDVVPIVVACALAALIIVVLIAYLVGRRRSRQKGYTSV